MEEGAPIRAQKCPEFRIRDEALRLVTNSPKRQPVENRRAYNNLNKHICSQYRTPVNGPQMPGTRRAAGFGREKRTDIFVKSCGNNSR